MKVRVVAVTKPVIEEAKSAEEFIAYAAKVSNPSKQGELETAPKLMKYLVEHEHWSPFEMAHVVMEIETTRDIARQILRHRSFSFQEFSQRYADASQLGFELRECRLQDPKNRQNSIVIDTSDVDGVDLAGDWIIKQQDLLELVEDTYEWALSSGIAKEQARAILPEGLTHSKLYMSGTVRSWIHYCKLRSKSTGTQKEHYEIAEACKKELEKIFPNIFKILDNENKNCK